MAKYTLIDPITGQQWILLEDWLTRELEHNCILIRNGEHIGIITHRDLVLFARWCAGEALAQLEGEPDQTVTHALSLVDQWLDDERSVTPEELSAAAWAIASEAAWASRAARVAVSASDAVRLVTEAAWAANSYISFKSQAQWFVEHLQSGK